MGWSVNEYGGVLVAIPWLILTVLDITTLVIMSVSSMMILGRLFISEQRDDWSGANHLS